MLLSITSNESIHCLLCHSNKVSLRIAAEEYKLYFCSCCGVFFLMDFEHNVSDSADEFVGIDIRKYLQSMEPLRRATARRAMALVDKYKKPGYLLDVGSSFGWLLMEANSKGWSSEGIEPSIIAVNHSVSNKCNVKHGYFPDFYKGSGKIFDCITLMDVLEHLSDPVSILRAAYGHLSDDGLVILSTPESSGLIFRMASFFVRHSIYFGSIERLMRRLLQLDFPYPHLWYFNKESLSFVASESGFEVVYSEKNRVFPFGSAFSRLTYSSPGQQHIFRPLFESMVLEIIGLIQDLTKSHDLRITILKKKIN